MSGRDPWEVFEKANRGWFDEGRTAAAVAGYDESLRLLPDEPAVLYQRAKAALALDDRTRAQELHARLALAPATHPLTAELIEVLADELATPFRLDPPLPVRELDVDVLDARRLTGSQWYGIIGVAEEREMFGLAIYGYDQLPLDHVMADGGRDLGRTQMAARAAWRLLRELAGLAGVDEPS